MNRERAPTDNELAVLDIWLRHKTDAAQSLRDQLGQPFTVSRSCGCGCGSIALHLGAEAVRHRLATDGTYEVEGFVETDDALGGLLLFIRNGVIAEIDAHSFGDSHLQFPEPETVRWGARRGGNAVVPFATELVVKAAVVAEFVDTIRSRFTPLGDTECRFAGITTVHDEYDIETGHIGPLRSYAYFFDPDGRRIRGAFHDTETVAESLEFTEGLGVTRAAWIHVEEAMSTGGDLPCRVLDHLTVQD